MNQAMIAYPAERMDQDPGQGMGKTRNLKMCGFKPPVRLLEFFFRIDLI